MLAIKQNRLSHAREISNGEKDRPERNGFEKRVDKTREKRKFLTAHDTGRAECTVERRRCLFAAKLSDVPAACAVTSGGCVGSNTKSAFPKHRTLAAAHLQRCVTGLATAHSQQSVTGCASPQVVQHVNRSRSHFVNRSSSHFRQSHRRRPVAGSRGAKSDVKSVVLRCVRGTSSGCGTSVAA